MSVSYDIWEILSEIIDDMDLHDEGLYINYWGHDPEDKFLEYDSVSSLELMDRLLRAYFRRHHIDVTEDYLNYMNVHERDNISFLDYVTKQDYYYTGDLLWCSNCDSYYPDDSYDMVWIEDWDEPICSDCLATDKDLQSNILEQYINDPAPNRTDLSDIFSEDILENLGFEYIGDVESDKVSEAFSQILSKFPSAELLAYDLNIYVRKVSADELTQLEELLYSV